MRDKLLREKPAKNKNRSPATVVRYLAGLSHLCSTSVKEWEWLKENPVLKVSKPKEPAGRARYLSKEEIKTLLRLPAKIAFAAKFDDLDSRGYFSKLTYPAKDRQFRKIALRGKKRELRSKWNFAQEPRKYTACNPYSTLRFLAKRKQRVAGMEPLFSCR